jgi:ribonuclease HI
VRKIGVCDALNGEMWGMYLGLKLSWSDGISHLCVESDSKLLIDMVTNNCKTNGTALSLIRHIRNLLDRSWCVEVHHTGREGNTSADWLAILSLTIDS